MTDWQTIALGALSILYAGLLWEIRQLRKAKHEHAQRITEALMTQGTHERRLARIERVLNGRLREHDER